MEHPSGDQGKSFPPAFASDDLGKQALRVVCDFMKKLSVEGKVILAVITGSRAYNVDVPDSDYDYKAVYLAPTEHWFGLDLPAEQHHNPNTTTPDITIYEAKGFCKEVLRGNPFALELVYSERYYYCTPEWREFLQFKTQLLTPQAVMGHVEYSRGQLEEHLKKRKLGKRQYHAIRILFAVEDIVAGRGIRLWLEGDRRDLCMKIRHEGFSNEEFIALAESMRIALSGVEGKAPSIEAPTEAVQAWLRRVRVALLRPDP